MKRQPKLMEGVDISMHTLDIALISEKNEIVSFKINNAPSDLRDFVREIKERFKVRNADLAFCAENMGLYAKFLTSFPVLTMTRSMRIARL